MLAVDHETETRNLEQLLQVFGARFSLEDIASAYWQSKGNIDMAVDILCATDEGSSSTMAGISEGKMADTSTALVECSSGSENSSAAPLEISSYHVPEKSYCVGRNGTARPQKSKKCSASVGTVSSVIGKDYARTRPSTKASSETTKPVKLDSKEFPVSEIWPEEASPKSTVATGNGTQRPDIEGFLLNMLEDGFQLDKTIIQEILGSCGCDLQKGVDKLIDLSAASLGKSDDVVGVAAELAMDKCAVERPFSEREHKFSSDSAQSEGATSMEKHQVVDRFNMQKEVLESLFTAPERSEEEPRKILKPRRSLALGKLVTRAPRDTTSSRTAAANNQELRITEEEDDENSFNVLRQAVKEYWFTMREYYKAAADAFAKGDKARAKKFLEEGNFYKKKAREADEKSAQKLIEPSSEDVTMSVDIHNFEPTEALRLLRTHLTNISGIPTMTYLKLIVGTTDEDPKFLSRKRKIIKQLEKESIKWTEEDEGRTMIIKVDVINPRKLSFAKSKTSAAASSRFP